MSDLLLTFLIFAPLILGLFLLIVPERFSHYSKTLALGGAVLTSLMSFYLWSQMELNGQLQFVQQLDWIPFWGVQYHVGVDGISLFLVLLSTVFPLLAMLYAWYRIENGAGRFFALLLIFEAGLIGTSVAMDLFLFYMFWELMLLPMFFLIGLWGGPQRKKAVMKFFIYTMAGSLIFLLSIIYLATQFYTQHHEWTFNLQQLITHDPFARPMADLLFVGFCMAFLIKLPLFPLHTWLPDTYVEAPTEVTFLLSGVMAKMGVYGLVRIAFPLFPEVISRWAPIFSGLAILGIIYGAILAIGQTNIKRLVAYSSISHLGLIALGVFSWNSLSIEGVVYHMMNHAVATGALFLMVGLLEQRYGTTEIKELGGLAQHAPIFASAFILLTFASIGVPGLNGFVGEFMILLGVAGHNILFTMAAALTLILSAAYMLWLTQRFLFGPSQLPEKQESQAPKLQIAAIAPLCILCILMGLYTAPFTQQIGPAVKKLIASQVKLTQHVEGQPHG